MQAIILAAGMGSRLGAHTRSLPKALVSVQGAPLLEHTLSALDAAGVEECLIGVGYLAEVIVARFGRRFGGVTLRYIENPDYASTNNITTMFRCGSAAEGEVVTFEGDVLFHPELLDTLVASPPSDRAVLSPVELHMDGTMATVDGSGVIREFIPKAAQPAWGVHGGHRTGPLKTVNIYRFTAPFLRELYLPALVRHMGVHGTHAYYEEVLGELVRKGVAHIEGVIVPGTEWAEVDTPEDLARAEALPLGAPTGR